MRVLIVDDEIPARKRIRNLLRGDSAVSVVAEAGNGRDAVTAIRRHRPDLVFLDIQMPILDGFGVIDAAASDHLPMIIFVTAYDQYALRALKAHALDYLLKPFDDDEFRVALAHARATLRRRTLQDFAEKVAGLMQESTPESPRPAKDKKRTSRFVVKDRGKIYFVPVDDIDWIEASGKYAVLHTGTRKHLLRETLRAVMEQLDPDLFVRVHRSAIVCVPKIRELQPWGRGEYRIILTNGTRLTSARSARSLLAALGAHR